MNWELSTSELFAIIMFTLAFNLAWYFALKYLKEKAKNNKRGNMSSTGYSLCPCASPWRSDVPQPLCMGQ